MNLENFVYAYNNFTGEHEIMYLRSEGALYYIYVVEEIEGQYGPQLLVVVDGMTTIYALPTTKAFMEGLEVGNYYKIIYEGETFFDNGYTRHEYDIERISADEYKEKAKDNFQNDKSY